MSIFFLKCPEKIELLIHLSLRIIYSVYFINYKNISLIIIFFDRSVHPGTTSESEWPAGEEEEDDIQDRHNKSRVE